MNLYIECPVCEQKFSTPSGPPEEQIGCPVCSRTFELSAAVRLPPPHERTADGPGSIRRLETPALESPGAVPGENDEPPAFADSAPNSDPETVRRKPILALQRKRRSRRRLITTLFSFAILATMIGVLTGLLIKQLKQNAIASKGVDGTVLSDENGIELDDSDGGSDTGLTDEGPTADTEKRQPVVARKKRLPPKNIPPQKFSYLKRKQSLERWNAVRPHLVSLQVFDGLGSHEAVGTIVDSRGWILTSFSAVQGASKIEVTASLSSIDDYEEANPLTDLVRGYVAEQKENDLVLLSINRRFVVAFSTVQPAIKNKIVESEYLLQCAPPSLDNLYGGTETRIVKRGNLESLDPAGLARAREKNLDTSDLVWLVATGQSPPLPGTPLFRVDGDLVGFNVFNALNQNYYLPVEHVKRLISEAEDDVKPLRELGVAVGDDTPVAVATTNEMYEPSVRLNQLARSCEAFNWIPNNRDDYQVLQEFTEAYLTIEKYALEHADSTATEEKKIVAQQEQLASQIHQRAASLSNEEMLTLTEMNKNFASHELREANRNVPFFGEVHSVDVVNAQLIVKLVGTERYVKAPFVPSGTPLRMNTTWLFFSRTPEVPRRVNYRVSESEIIEAESVDRLLNFGKQ